jgi:hypothetical protein
MVIIKTVKNTAVLLDNRTSCQIKAKSGIPLFNNFPCIHGLFEKINFHFFSAIHNLYSSILHITFIFAKFNTHITRYFDSKTSVFLLFFFGFSIFKMLLLLQIFFIEQNLLIKMAVLLFLKIGFVLCFVSFKVTKLGCD